MRTYHRRGNNSAKQKQHSYKKIFILLIIVFILGILFLRQSATAPSNNSAKKTEGVQSNIDNPPEQPSYPDLQPLVDQWVSSHSGVWSIKINDPQGKTLAEYNPDKGFFAASLYKLYVAYAGYQQVDNAIIDIDAQFIGGKTYGQCLDAMIRSSDSQCGEAMMSKLGQQDVTNNMKQLGLKNTSLSAIETSANDAALLLTKLFNGYGLSQKSRDSFLDSMKEQPSKFRSGLPSGLQGLEVYNKVGWNLDKEWHDAAIIKISDNKQIIVTVLTNGAGRQNIVDFGTEINKKLK